MTRRGRAERDEERQAAWNTQILLASHAPVAGDGVAEALLDSGILAARLQYLLRCLAPDSPLLPLTMRTVQHVLDLQELRDGWLRHCAATDTATDPESREMSERWPPDRLLTSWPELETARRIHAEARPAAEELLERLPEVSGQRFEMPV